MKPYYIYVKSHCEAPDFEDEREFKNKKEAAKYWAESLSSDEGGDWGIDDVMPYIFCEDIVMKKIEIERAKILLKTQGYKISKK